MVTGLIITPQLMQRQVSIDLNFEPSVGILARKVDKLGLNIKSFRVPLHDSVKKVMIPSIRKNFDVGGRPKWVPLAMGTIAQKGGNTAPLIRDGSLRRQMGYIKIWHIDSEKAMIADLPQSIWYGKVHQAGLGGTTTVSVRNIATGAITNITEESEGGIPARPFVMIQKQDERGIERIFDQWLKMRIKMAGL